MINHLTFVAGISLKENVYGGETIKNKIFLKFIKESYPALSIKVIDTYNWRKQWFSLVSNILSVFLNKHKKVIILSVSERGASIFFKGLKLLFWVKKDVYYFITGTVPDNFIKNLPGLLSGNCRPLLIVSEIEKQRKKLESPELPPVLHINNWKYYSYVPDPVTKNYPKAQLKIFTFSRIDESKGTSILFDALKIVNKDQVLIEADLYGIIDPAYQHTFDQYIAAAPYCNYRKTIDLFNEKNYAVLSQYDLMVFPTFHPGEGFAGTLIDCFIAGVPVAASDWNYNAEIIRDGYNGYLFKVKDVDALVQVLLNAYHNQDRLNALRLNCVENARQYKIDTQLKALLPQIVEDNIV